jgi:hypothetical protein
LAALRINKTLRGGLPLTTRPAICQGLVSPALDQQGAGNDRPPEPQRDDCAERPTGFCAKRSDSHHDAANDEQGAAQQLRVQRGKGSITAAVP